MKTEDLLQQESLRMEAFRLLSDCYRLPGAGISEIIKDLEFSLAAACEAAVFDVRKMRSELDGHECIEALKIDFSKLFVGPYQLFAAPYGSVYLDGERKMMGPSTLDVRHRYQEAGLDTAESFQEAPDHITAELEFMYYLIFKEVEAFSHADPETAVGFVQRQKCFLEDHLMAWVPEFAKSITACAQTRFYPHLAAATETFLKESHRVVNRVLGG